MKTVGIINFHMAYNYGSVLLAYAITRVVKDLGADCKIINYQPKKQIDSYQLPVTTGRHCIKKIIERICWIPYLKEMKKKYQLFDEFRAKYIPQTPYTNNPEEITDVCGTFDYVMAGGDQIWNPRCAEFEWTYYLDFVKEGRKIAYATSIGTIGTKEWNKDVVEHIKESVSSFYGVAIRENQINHLINSNFPIVLDPTMLISQEEWNSLAGEQPIVKGNYIFYYDPFDMPDSIKYTKEIARDKIAKLVSSNIYMILKADRKTFDYHLSVGPKEFLNLIKYAKLCVGHSFHLAIFSLIFRKNFQIENGLTDSRTSELLNRLSRNREYLYTRNNHIQVEENFYDSIFEEQISIERKRSIEELKKMLS